MSNDLLRKKDLVNNPTARVPVCLCLDTSGSMDRVIGDDFQRTGRQEYSDGQMWDIVTGGTSAIDELNKGVEMFYDAIRSDEVAMYSAEICVVTFGGNEPKLVLDFASIERQTELPKLTASGETPMGEAVNLALDCLERRKQEYSDVGLSYFQPWLVLMTDGEPNGSSQELERAVKRTVQMVQDRKLTVFPIGIGDDADMQALARFSPNRQPKRLRETKFPEFFQWLSQSVSRTSQSTPGEKVPLDIEGMQGWAEI
jgi:uncharacterized protein YegL